MAVPKFRKSKSKTMIRRRANDKRSIVETVECPECGKQKLPHRVCGACGSYKGQTIIRKKA